MSKEISRTDNNIVRTDLVIFKMPSGGEFEAFELNAEDMNLLNVSKDTFPVMLDVLKRRLAPYGKDTKEFNPLTRPLADFFTGLFKIRISTHGHELWWKPQCDNLRCNHRWWHVEDLSKDFFKPKPIKWAPTLEPIEESETETPKEVKKRVEREKLIEKTGGYDLEKGAHPDTLEFIMQLDRRCPDPKKPLLENGRPNYIEGLRIRARLFRGADSPQLDQMKEQDKATAITRRINSLIVGFEDYKQEDGTLLQPSEEWLKTLGMNGCQQIDEVYQQFDGGIESNTDIECPRCEDIIEDAPIPINDRRFFLRKSSRKPSIAS